MARKGTKKTKAGAKRTSRPSDQDERVERLHLWDVVTSLGDREEAVEALKELSARSPRMAVYNIIELLFSAFGVAGFSDDLYEDATFVEKKLKDRLAEVPMKQSLKDIPVLKTSGENSKREKALKYLLIDIIAEYDLTNSLESFPLFIEALKQLCSSKDRSIRIAATMFGCTVSEQLVVKLLALAMGEDNSKQRIMLLRVVHSFWLEYLLKERINDVNSQIRRSVSKSLLFCSKMQQKSFFVPLVISKTLETDRNKDYKKESAALRSCDWVKAAVEILKAKLIDPHKKVVE